MVAARQSVISFRRGHRTLGFGGLPLRYVEETGEVIIGDEAVQGDEFLEDLKHVIRHIERSRKRHRLGPDEQSEQGFIGLNLDTEGILREQRDAAWKNLPLYYPEPQREEVTARVDEARKVIEG